MQSLYDYGVTTLSDIRDMVVDSKFYVCGVKKLKPANGKSVYQTLEPMQSNNARSGIWKACQLSNRRFVFASEDVFYDLYYFEHFVNYQESHPTGHPMLVSKEMAEEIERQCHNGKYISELKVHGNKVLPYSHIGIFPSEESTKIFYKEGSNIIKAEEDEVFGFPYLMPFRDGFIAKMFSKDVSFLIRESMFDETIMLDFVGSKESR